MDEYTKVMKQITEASLDEKKKKKLIKDLEVRMEDAFVNLPVFTGGTLCNSYAESINSRLRSIGCRKNHSRLEVIIAIREYCRHQYLPVESFRLSRQILMNNARGRAFTCIQRRFENNGTKYT